MTGMIALGAAPTPLFRASGSLPGPMLIHAFLDLRVLLVRAPAQVTTGDAP